MKTILEDMGDGVVARIARATCAKMQKIRNAEGLQAAEVWFHGQKNLVENGTTPAWMRDAMESDQ